MARIVISPQAAECVKGLPKERALLGAIWRHLEQAANDPRHILPPAYPYRWPMINFRAYDSSKNLWAVTVLLRHETAADAESVLHVILIQAGRFPDDLDPDDFFPDDDTA